MVKKLLKNVIIIKSSFLFKKKILTKIEVKNNICINMFGYENMLVFLIYISDQKFEDSMDLLPLSDNNK